MWIRSASQTARGPQHRPAERRHRALPGLPDRLLPHGDLVERHLRPVAAGRPRPGPGRAGQVAVKAPGHEPVAVGVDEIAGHVLAERGRRRTRQAEVHGAAAPERDLRPARHRPDLEAVAGQEPSAARTLKVLASSCPSACRRGRASVPLSRFTSRSQRRDNASSSGSSVPRRSRRALRRAICRIAHSRRRRRRPTTSSRLSGNASTWARSAPGVVAAASASGQPCRNTRSTRAVRSPACRRTRRRKGPKSNGARRTSPSSNRYGSTRRGRQRCSTSRIAARSASIRPASRP